MDELPMPVELFILILVAEGTLPPTAWEDLRSRLDSPQLPLDPALGVEFALAELPDEVIENIVLPGVRKLAADFPRREAERKANPPTPDALGREVERAAARLAAVMHDLAALGCRIVPEVSPRDSDDFA